MKTTPVTTITLYASAICTVLGFIAICGGYFMPAAILGLCAAINLMAGIFLKGY